MAKGVNIIDVISKIPNDVYYVRKSWDNRNSQILCTRSYEKAKQCVDNSNGNYYVFDSQGKVKYIRKNKVHTSLNIKPGMTIHAVSINLYSNPSATIPTMACTGDISIVHSQLFGDKYKVYKEGIGEMFVKIDDIRKYFS